MPLSVQFCAISSVQSELSPAQSNSVRCPVIGPVLCHIFSPVRAQSSSIQCSPVSRYRSSFVPYLQSSQSSVQLSPMQSCACSVPSPAYRLSIAAELTPDNYRRVSIIGSACRSPPPPPPPPGPQHGNRGERAPGRRC